jgi:hypothetical protein
MECKVSMAERELTEQLEPKKQLFERLNGIIEDADKKRHSHHNNDNAKQGWARIEISAINAYGSILKDAEIEQLKTRFAAMEQTLQELKEARTCKA